MTPEPTELEALNEIIRLLGALLMLVAMIGFPITLAACQWLIFGKAP